MTTSAASTVTTTRTKNHTIRVAQTGALFFWVVKDVTDGAYPLTMKRGSATTREEATTEGAEYAVALETYP